MDNAAFLIIDDDKDDVDIFVEATKEIDPSIMVYAITKSENMLNELNHITVLPSYVFLDLNMPMVSGLDCLRQLKSHAVFQDIPVIILSTSEYKKDILAARELGASYYLSKASTYPVLKDHIRFIISGEWKQQLSTAQID